MQSYLNAMGRFSDFDGRTGRGEFWRYSLIATVVIVAARYVQMTWHASAPIGDLVMLAHIIPSATAQIRRLHDTGRTGYWLWIGITIIGLIPLLYWCCQRSAEPGEGGGGSNQRVPLANARTLDDQPGMQTTYGTVQPDPAARPLADRSRMQRGNSASLTITLAIAGAAVVFGLVWGKDDILRAMAIIQAASRPTAEGPGNVVAALKQRSLEKAVVFTGSDNDSVLNGVTVSMMATCLQYGAAHASRNSTVSFSDDSSSYRLAGADGVGHPTTVHFEKSGLPGLVRLTEVDIADRTAGDPTSVRGAVVWLLLECRSAFQ